MQTLLITVLSLVVVGLSAWIVRDVRKSGSFTTQDAIAALGVLVSLITVVVSSGGSEPAASPSPTRSVATPSVVIEGPLTAPLGETTLFTFVSQNATRAEWSIGGFNNNQSITVEPLAASHEIFVEPTDVSRAGDTFTIVVTVYGEEGERATAMHRFEVTEE